MSQVNGCGGYGGCGECGGGRIKRNQNGRIWLEKIQLGKCNRSWPLGVLALPCLFRKFPRARRAEEGATLTTALFLGSF